MAKLPPMPPTEDRQDDAVEGYKECTNSWVRRNLEATDWLIDNHEEVRRAVITQPLLIYMLKYVLDWHDRLTPSDVQSIRKAIETATNQPTQGA